jgi:hypothetical protein
LNHGIVVRNHSYGNFSGAFSLASFGGAALYVTAYARGNQYNSFTGAWSISGNYGYGIHLAPDAAGGPGGYVNDCLFSCIRVFNPLNAAGNTQCYIDGGFENRFLGCAFESGRVIDTLLHMVSGQGQSFFGLRLDGITGTTAMRLDANAIANWFFGYSTDGFVVDTSGKNLFISDRGTGSLPFIRLGGNGATGTQSYLVEMAQPGSILEMNIGPQEANGYVRFPSAGKYGFGDRESGDGAVIEIDPTNKRLSLQTITPTNIGSGPTIRFDGRFAGDGNFGIQSLSQDAYGFYANASAGYGFHVTTYLSVTDGTTAPAAVAGRARIYVDAADGDLKIKFGDGTVKTIVTDT